MTPALTLHTRSPEETQAVGRAIGEQAQAGDIFLLTGPLGAGKTCLTQGIAWGLGVAGYTRSPTFVLMTRHRGRLPLYHMDLYRIGDPAEAWDLGLDETLFGDGVCVVEWADRAGDLFPAEALWIALDYAPDLDQRSIAFSPKTLGGTRGSPPYQGGDTEGVVSAQQPGTTPPNLPLVRGGNSQPSSTSERHRSLLEELARRFAPAGGVTS